MIGDERGHALGVGGLGLVPRGVHAGSLNGTRIGTGTFTYQAKA